MESLVPVVPFLTSIVPGEEMLCTKMAMKVSLRDEEGICFSVVSLSMRW